VAQEAARALRRRALPPQSVSGDAAAPRLLLLQRHADGARARPRAREHGARVQLAAGAGGERTEHDAPELLRHRALPAGDLPGSTPRRALALPHAEDDADAGARGRARVVRDAARVDAGGV